MPPKTKRRSRRDKRVVPEGETLSSQLDRNKGLDEATISLRRKAIEEELERAAHACCQIDLGED